MTQTITFRTRTDDVETSESVDRRPDRFGRTIGAAIAATALAVSTGLLAYRAVNGAPAPTTSADTSHETAEHHRQLSLAPAANVDLHLDSFDVAESARMGRLAGVDSFDVAESARMGRLADTSTARP
jgi:hypothetical protein